MSKSEFDIKAMGVAVDLAKQAFEKGFSPVGAVLAKDDKIVSMAYSMRRIGNLLHAEYMVMSDYQEQGLAGLTLYTTLEPCIMCSGMAIVGKIDRVVFLVKDYWGGLINFCGSEYILSRETKFGVIDPDPDTGYDSVWPLYKDCEDMWKKYLTDTGHEWAIKGMLGIDT